LAIEFLDELVFGVREAAWPSIRGELGLSYASLGLLLTVPSLVSGLLEPAIALAGGGGRRHVIIVLGGLAFGAGLAVAATAGNFAVLMVGFVVLYPASGAFVVLTQAQLMDTDATRHEVNMARWTLAGSVGVVAGPLLLAGALRVGLGWRPLFLVGALVSVPLALRCRRKRVAPTRETGGFGASLRLAVGALRNRSVLRWLALLELTNLLGDVLAGFLALYLVDVVHLRLGGAAIAIVVWTLAGLAGDSLLVAALGRVSSLAYLRCSGVATLVAYPAFLLVPSLPLKLVLLGVVGFLHAGWYAIPQARLYTELLDDSNVAVAMTNVAGLVGGMFPLLLGIAAERWGLPAAMWLCALAPLALVVGLPRNRLHR
jgi:FSR family fosmidomycin resistance protein-like MFS transporter